MNTFHRMLGIFAAICMSTAAMFGQGLPALPNDPAVRQGQLDNGLTYYIRHNANPEGRAEFYLATHVGALQETPDQDGLAHFLEHMCFNGTKNFPGKGILNYLQGIGASFGGNVNASTGVEQTIYMLTNIPLVNESVADSCILIMHDYSHFVTCDPAEIDAERGVILEEKRSRNSASWRMHEKAAPYYYGDSKYATTTIIGSEENLKTFKPESLTNFYHTWYQPCNQALIVVGDIDVDVIESKIKTIFADIPAAENPKVKDIIKVPAHAEPHIGIITDPENTASRLELLWTDEPMPREHKNTISGLANDIIENVIGLVMQERFGDIAAQSDAPFLSAALYMGKLTESAHATMGQLYFKDGESVSALKAFYTEIEKMRKFGFTEAEYERAKSNIINEYESAAKKASTRKNNELVFELIGNFFDNEPYMEPSTSAEIVKQILDMIPLAGINEALGEFNDENLSIIYYGTEKEGNVHPTSEELGNVLNEVKFAELQANEDSSSELTLLDASKLKGSKITSRSTGLYGSKVLTLKNGIKVILYPNELEKDKIAFQLIKQGGMSLIGTEDLPNVEDNIFGLYISNTGLAHLSERELSKVLTGMTVSVSPYIEDLEHGVSGSSSVKDFETALQLTYLFFTAPRFDETEYNQGIERIKSVLPNLVNSPGFKMQQHLYNLWFKDDRHLLISEDVLAKANLASLERIYKSLFHDAAGATLVISGDFNPDEVEPLVQKYIGSLPKGKKATTWIDRHTQIADGERTDDFTTEMQAPKVTVVRTYTSREPFTYTRSAALKAASYILDMRYVTSLREEEGGTYGAQSYGAYKRLPSSFAALQVMFETNTEAVERLRELATKGLTELANDGPTESEFDMAVKNLQKNIPESRKNNRYWLGKLVDNENFHEDGDALYEEAVNNLKPSDIQDVLKELLGSGNATEMVMRP